MIDNSIELLSQIGSHMTRLTAEINNDIGQKNWYYIRERIRDPNRRVVHLQITQLIRLQIEEEQE